MPPSTEILVGLQTIANEWRSAAIAWHIALGAFVVALLAGWRPGRRLAALLLAAPLASVSAMAWLGGNPFNGTVFAVTTLALAVVALRLPDSPVTPGGQGAVMVGGFLVPFGWFYPEFLVDVHWTAYAYASPLGLIPCPTLMAVTGLTLALGGFGSRAWPPIVAVVGVLYGLMGVLALGVSIDAVLVAGALVLGATLVKVGRPRAGREGEAA